MAMPVEPRDFIDWDVRNWSAALDYWLARTRKDLSKCYALELGSRHGGLSLWLALQGARVICSDIRPPTDSAKQRHRKYGVADRIQYQIVDATDIGYENEFDVVAFKSLLGGLGTRE
jgi:2-polyprenyl-3-methyl-5-hydroxy-6-metoxy-1,4-benzoquinol methylase